MRGRLSAIVAVALACASLLHTVSGTMNCIGYEPFSNQHYPNQIYDALYGDLEKIKNLGFPCIKTYYSQFMGLNAAEVAKNSGLQIVIGIRMEEAGIVEAEINAAIEACEKYPDTVLAIYAGNENLPGDSKNVINIRNRVKERCSKPFGTVQKNGYWENKGEVDWEMFHALDWWGFNVYSFFGPLNGKSSVDVVKDQINALHAAYPDVVDRLYLTETGWPSAGGESQGNVADFDNAKAFADGVANMICSGEIKTQWMSYFIFNDPMYKQNVPEFEKHFGVASVEGEPKWDLSKLSHCGGSDHSHDRSDSQDRTTMRDNRHADYSRPNYGAAQDLVGSGNHGHTSDRRDSYRVQRDSRRDQVMRRDSSYPGTTRDRVQFQDIGLPAKHDSKRLGSGDHARDSSRRDVYPARHDGRRDQVIRRDSLYPGATRDRVQDIGFPARRDRTSKDVSRRDGRLRDTSIRAMGGASKVQIYNACGFDVNADLLVPQLQEQTVVGAGQWKEIELNEGNLGWVWKLYINGQASKPVQYEFSYDQGKLWYDLSLIDSQGGDLERNAMTLTCSDTNCHPTPNCQYTRCPSAYNADGSKACTIYQVYYPEAKCCYQGEPSYAAAGGSTITLTLC